MKAKDNPAADVERLVRDSLRLGGEAYSQLMGPSLELGRALFNDYLKLWQDAAGGVMRQSCGCRVPEQDCPPRCVCDLAWTLCPGGRLEGSLRLTNTGKSTRRYTLSATNLVSAGHDPDITPSLQPAEATLEPGQSVLVQVGAQGTERLEIGREYTAEIRVAGLYEQCVRLQVTVEASSRPHCEVEQGEMPMRVRAHRWSDHFQCEEPCFEPVRRQPEGGGIVGRGDQGGNPT